MSTPGGSFTPRTGTYMVGVVNLVSSLISTQTVKFFGRRTLVIWGHAGIAVVHFMVAYFHNTGNNNGMLAMILLFLFVYQNTSGPVAWLYAAETTIDVALGICLLTLWGTVFCLSLATPVLMNKDSLGSSGVFNLFGGLSIVGCIYVLVVFKESKGLSDKEKKSLYMP